MRSIQDQRQGVHILQHMPRALTEGGSARHCMTLGQKPTHPDSDVWLVNNVGLLSGAQSKKTSKRNDRRHPMQAEELQKLFDYILGVGPICFRSWLDHDTSAVIRKSGEANDVALFLRAHVLLYSSRPDH